MGLNLANLGGKPNPPVEGDPLVPAAEVVESQPEPTVESKIWTSAPISRYKVGKFQFDRGVLTLDDPEQIAEFEALLKKLPARERNAVRTISMKLAESMVRPIEPGMTKSFDSSVGRQRERLATGDQTVGDVALDAPHRTESRDDMNIALNEGQGTGDSTTAQQ